MFTQFIFRKGQIKKLLAALAAIFTFMLLVLLFWKMLGAAGMGYDWHWNRVWRYLGRNGPDGFVPGPLLKGIWITISITGLGLALTIPLALLACWARLSPWPLCALLARSYILLWRNTPLLLQLFMAYFLAAPLLGLSAFWTAIFCLTLFEASYCAEIFRSGILSVHKTQWESALCLGLGMGQTFFLVILPQALRNVLPSLVNQSVALLKDSTLVSAIAVADLTMQSQAIVSESFLAFEIWLLAGAIYLVLALFISLPGIFLEKSRPYKRNLA